jgi:septal ring factor EnvC (AmiA/AmiB activator)
MKIVNSRLLVVFSLFLGLNTYAQSSDKLKKEQDQLELKIKSTKLLLDQTKSNTEASLNELKLIDNQVKLREQLVRNFDNQIRTADVTIVSKADQIEHLERRLVSLKEQYKKLLLYAYKKRNKYGKLMYIFSSKSYNQALKRKKYLESIQEIQQKQFLVIQQNQQLIKKEITEINKEKQQKLVVLDEKRKEKEAILIDKSKQENVYNGFKNKEDKLFAQLRDDERKKAILNAQINIAIKKEIAAAEAKRKVEEERRRKAELAKKSTEKSEATPNVDIVAPSIALTEAREGKLIDKSFEANRGRLPWPVDKGSITENFGRNPHPTLDNVYTNNNGIDISAPKNSEVRSVFDGEVTSILNIPGAGKVVIMKHGNYRTVYSNLQSTYVSIGDKVNTKQVIGSLLVKSGQSLSVVHFEIHQVIGSNVQSLNPAVWVDR